MINEKDDKTSFDFDEFLRCFCTLDELLLQRGMLSSGAGSKKRGVCVVQ